MQIIPAIDLMDGKCVRLVKGDPKKSKVYANDPIKMAMHWITEGANFLHIIDLDAALGIGNNYKIITVLNNQISAKIQVGGGIHTAKYAKNLLDSGISRIIFGSQFVSNQKLVEDVIQQFGTQRVAIALDVKEGKIMVDGWKKSSGIDYIELANVAEALNVGALICTSVEMDGTLRGPAFEYIEHLVNNINIPIIASGGVSSIEDLRNLANTGVEGTIVGAALYEQKFTLKEALEEL